MVTQKGVNECNRDVTPKTDGVRVFWAVRKFRDGFGAK
jgi:hypothetical protein